MCEALQAHTACEEGAADDEAEFSDDEKEAEYRRSAAAQAAPAQPSYASQYGSGRSTPQGRECGRQVTRPARPRRPTGGAIEQASETTATTCCRSLHPWPAASNACASGVVHDSQRLIIATFSSRCFATVKQEARSCFKIGHIFIESPFLYCHVVRVCALATLCQVSGPDDS